MIRVKLGVLRTLINEVGNLRLLPTPKISISQIKKVAPRSLERWKQQFSEPLNTKNYSLRVTNDGFLYANEIAPYNVWDAYWVPEQDKWMQRVDGEFVTAEGDMEDAPEETSGELTANEASLNRVFATFWVDSRKPDGDYSHSREMHNALFDMKGPLEARVRMQMGPGYEIPYTGEDFNVQFPYDVSLEEAQQLLPKLASIVNNFYEKKGYKMLKIGPKLGQLKDYV